jgi:LmbE family N-acetylglucosaminyl deacetylase
MCAGARVEVICLSHARVWTMDEAPADLATLRGAEQARAAEVLGPNRVQMQDCANERRGEACQMKLATEVVVAAHYCHPDGLLAFDTPALSDHLEHVAATSAGLLAAETLDLPVLGWTLSETVAAQLSRQFGTSFLGHHEEQIDLRVIVERARQRLASQAEAAKATPSAARHRLEILADTQSQRWLRV